VQSLSFALAGVFGLDIYVISLLEPTLTEEDLSQLFTSLPRRCVVLLEDIDTAGLIRSDTDKETSTSKSTSGTSSDSDSFKVADLAKAIKKANDTSEEEKKKGISLSGLLNAIDGVASHEGRVLVMTTNKPEKLDDALIRPGRVDLQVAFGNATKPQIKELFERMYTSDKPAKSRLSASAPYLTQKPPKPGKASKTLSILTPPATPVIEDTFAVTVPAACGLPERTLEEIAAEFAAKIPDDKFSPAEVQGFLLKRKKNPQKALAEIERWVESMLELKASKTKVLEVQ
jgi:mitochondrial chaperone BCS1